MGGGQEGLGGRVSVDEGEAVSLSLQQSFKGNNDCGIPSL